MSRQTSITQFWQTPANGGNRARPTNSTITPEQEAQIERKRQAALERRRRWQQNQQQAPPQQQPAPSPQNRSSTLTPAINRMRMTPQMQVNGNATRLKNASNSNNSRQIPENGRSPLHNTVNTVQTAPGSRSLRKRRRQDYVEEHDSDDSPVRPTKKSRKGNNSKRILDDSDGDDDDYQPEANELNAPSESDISSHHSVSPQRPLRKLSKSQKTSRIINGNNYDQKEEESLNDAINAEEDDDDMVMIQNHDNAHNKNQKTASRSNQKFGYNFNARKQDPNGDLTLDRISQFVRNDNNNDGNDSNTNVNEEELFERNPKYQYKSYDEFRERNQARLAGLDSAKQKSAGASHRDISNDEWFRNPRDFKGHDRNHADYNPSQIRVPASVLENKKKMTEAQKQYWKIKRQYFDSILFFKVGKFYELYYEDAEIAHKLCGLNYMGQSGDDDEKQKSGVPHVGFPERSVDRYADILLQYNHKIVRVEQTETTDQQKKRSAKCVQREVTEVLTKGTVVSGDLLNDEANYILSIVEQVDNTLTSQIDVGICFMDFSTGEMHLGRFIDDRNRSRLRTLIYQINPSECVYKKDHLTKQTHSLLRCEFRSKNKVLSPKIADDTFYSAETAKNILQEEKYFGANVKFAAYPKALQQAWNHNLTMNAFGGILAVLQYTLHDREILPHCRWNIYDPTSSKCNNFLTLDGSTLANLEILVNEDGTRRGTLIQFLDHCHTKFGKRKLEALVRNPSNQIDVINERLDAVDYLMADWDFWYNEIGVGVKLDKLPDLERLLHHLCVLSTKNRMQDKAIMFENCWQKAKINKLLAVLDGFDAVNELLLSIEQHRNDIKSRLVDELTTVLSGEEVEEKQDHRAIPEFTSIVADFRASFDWDKAQSLGIIEPVAGHNADYDRVRGALQENKTELEEILIGVQKELRSKKVKWCLKKGKIRESYQIEIPKSLRFVPPEDWHSKGGTKTVDRYHTDEIADLLQQQEKLLNEEEMLLRDAARATFERFAQNGPIWLRIVENIAELDCLLSLSWVSQHAASLTMTRPEFVKVHKKSDAAFLEIRQCKHPCIDETQLNALGQQSASQFIPNDTVLGCAENDANFVMVTGPNMGGKSTLLRQTCIAVILAHIGCYVPCGSMRLTPVDRIFTRVGANDRILAGQSTFMVELEETSNILRHATKHSLVILDELGRGTSTHDGTAIAYAVAKQLIDEIECRCLFSTHYHGLTDAFLQNKKVAMYHMAYKESDDHQDITFLYQFTKGICKQSHGIHCAKLAGFPRKILERADEKARELHDRIHNPLQAQDEERVMQQFERVLTEILQDTIIDKMTQQK
eukprot:CAMPEP_0197038874 /NCGR_PEP_ID=MMETSP1384-20130603/15754_1 /TAXON_ID=29189 /ORGANISM="Ammonia sp." /LENGTH=1325 /DNA_ID=CAMNT_0042469375 /DNA_START=37 /DNA_END=4014 /DNA_ORIENTATION=-